MSWFKKTEKKPGDYQIKRIQMLGDNEGCARCRWFLGFKHGIEGLCLRFPPQPVVEVCKGNSYGPAWKSPVVQPQTWCGEFTPKDVK